MKKLFTLFIIIILLASTSAIKAQQVNNSGFETWDNLGAATEEPTDWNSFKTGTGTLSYLLSQQVKRSTVTRPGSTGMYSCVTWSKSTIGIVANGNFTTGQVNANSMTPSDPTNFNATVITNPAFSEAMTGQPDSLVAWVKFKPVGTGNDSARVSAIIHDSYNYIDPEDAASAPHRYGLCEKNFSTTNGQWVRISTPFTYPGPATSAAFILITFTTNKTPGGGTAADSLYVDDLSLIYNPGGIPVVNKPEKYNVYTDASDLIIQASFQKPVKSEICIYNISGQLVYKTQVNSALVSEHVALNTMNKGMYIVTITNEAGDMFSQKISLN